MKEITGEHRYSDPPCRQLTFNGMTVEGFSRAAMQTYWRIPELKLGFDFGGQPWHFMSTPQWFLSHTHMDHLLALPAYAARRRMMKMEPPTIFVPAHAVQRIRQLLDVFTRLDHGRLPCQLVGVMPGEEYELSREHVVSVVKTDHSIPSVGYIVWERRKKLKPEYQSLSEQEIRQLAAELRLAGKQVSAEIRFPRVAYLGDSTPLGLDNNPAMYEADILITEMSFAAKRHRSDKIHRYGHIHLDDIIDRRDKFRNGLIIASHFSTRCSDKEIDHIVRRRLPDMLDNRLVLWF
ncbi:MAG: metal-dependent hydrolase [Planctomycetaceae bacterium]|jgi:ribonuclease Z|nr:metal-dependent hydrolase [Planctomycetaceae bacterium]